MSSFIRRLQRTVMPSRPHYETVRGETKVVVNPPRGAKAQRGLGSRLGVNNRDDPCLIARQKREAKREAKKEGWA
jgi:hypothetical protein